MGLFWYSLTDNGRVNLCEVAHRLGTSGSFQNYLLTAASGEGLMCSWCGHWIASVAREQRPFLT